jgi:signal transduction histidine kinase
MAFLLADLFIKAALASFTIRWYAGIFFGLATIFIGILDHIFEKAQILNFLTIEPIPPLAYLIGFSIMLGTMGIIAIANALSYEKISKAYSAELKKRIMAENLLIEQNENLEQKVNDRTHEIENLNKNLTYANKNLYQINEELRQTNEELYNQKEELATTLNQLKLAQEQLIHSEKMASLGVLAAGVAHEINNPLNFISAGIFGIENYLNENQAGSVSELKPLLDKIQIGVERAAAIVTSLSSYSRHNELQMRECDIHSIIESCLVMLQSELKKGIEVVKKYSTEQYRVKCNEGKMHQAFLNILVNAAHAVENKGVISISSKIEGKYFVISISDSGSGIKEEDMARIFDPFFTTKEVGKGTGLGLSITYNIIKDHGGTIDIESQPGKGTKVSIQLPLLSSNEQEL